MENNADSEIGEVNIYDGFTWQLEKDKNIARNGVLLLN
jgi:hypothetical protein